MRTMQGLARCGLLAGALGWCLAVPPAMAQFTLLHSFHGGTNDGANPLGSPTPSGTNVFGMTLHGGTGVGLGTVFRMRSDGTSYTNLHVFHDAVGDGASPWGSLTLSGSMLYGMTKYGRGGGTVFKMKVDGSGCTNLHEFGAVSSDGYYPDGALTLSGTNLYGMTQDGGASELGVIFKLNVDGTGYKILHDFAGPPGDGEYPQGALTLSGTNLFGMTIYGGGPSNAGALFKMDLDGTHYRILHAFTDALNDGGLPGGDLTLVGTNLYGVAGAGGTSSNGVIFKTDIDGTGFTILHHFAGTPGDGAWPDGTLALSGSALYGMTDDGGTYDIGTIFKIDVNGTGYAVLHHFAGGAGDGARPSGSLALCGTALYGMTYWGGVSDTGTVFALRLSNQAPATATVTVAASPPSGGTVTGGGTYPTCSNIQIAAAASNGWLFTSWNDAATDNPYAIVVPATNITYTASFAQYAFTTNGGAIVLARYLGAGGAVTLPAAINGLPVTVIGAGAFSNCTSLTRLMIGSGVTNIGAQAFASCPNLGGVYFQGNAPTVSSTAFSGTVSATVYYLSGTAGWSSLFGGRPAVLWNPRVPAGDANFGVRTNRFGFTISGASNLVIVVDACTNLVQSGWSPVGTNTLTGGSSYFGDSQWSNCPGRFYRFRSP